MAAPGDLRPGAAPPEPPMVIEHREALVYLLAQACELEHGLMCEYLYAAFSLRRGEDEGLTPAQAEAVARWRQVIVGIATQEMLHLALANNMLAALGAAPHLSRPNLPDRARHYPADVRLAFLPFGERALRHFLYLERPEGMALHDAEGFAALEVAEPVVVGPDDIVPRGQEFATVGHLYRSIAQGFRHLADRMGEDRLFVGSPRAQATGDLFGWPELIAVTDVASATAAIETIVTEGEGAQGDWRDAHFGRFLAVYEEHAAMTAADPAFRPARPVRPTGVRPLPDLEPEVRCTDPLTAGVLDAFNTGYEVLLQLLERFFGHDTESDDELAVLADAAVSVMIGVVAPLGDLATTLPAGAAHPGVTAGPMFELFYGTGYLLPRQREAWFLLRERTELLAAFCRRLPAEDRPAEVLAAVAGRLDRIAGLLAR